MSPTVAWPFGGSRSTARYRCEVLIGHRQAASLRWIFATRGYVVLLPEIARRLVNEAFPEIADTALRSSNPATWIQRRPRTLAYASPRFTAHASWAPVQALAGARLGRGGSACSSVTVRN